MDENFKPENEGNNVPNDPGDPFTDLPQNNGQQPNNQPQSGWQQPYNQPQNGWQQPYNQPQNSWQQPQWQQPYNQSQWQQPYGMPANNSVQIKGKAFAIAAFILAVVAGIFALSALSLKLELLADLAYAESLSNSSVEYYVVNAGVIQLAVDICAVMSMIPAIVSGVLVIFAYRGNAQNVKNGVNAKFVLVFAILATVFASLSIIVSMILML